MSSSGLGRRRPALACRRMYKFIIYSYFTAFVFPVDSSVVNAWCDEWSLWWFGGFVVEDSGIRLVEGRGCGFGIGDRFVNDRFAGWLGAELNAVPGMKRIDGVDDSGNRQDRR